MRGPARWETRIRSPTRTSRAGLAACSLTSTLPPSHAAVAWLRLRKNRAAQSHLSRRRSPMRAYRSIGPALSSRDGGSMRHTGKAVRLAAATCLLVLAAAAERAGGQPASVVVEDWAQQALGK